MYRTKTEITGTLKLLSPLHIGTGDYELRSFLRADEGAGAAPRLATIVRDHEGQPYIPGTTLKGILRAAYCGNDPGSVFGEITDVLPGQEATDLDGAGYMGRLLFANCFQLTPGNRDHQPFAAEDNKGATYVLAGVTIDRDRGAAAEGRLFYREVVPAGTTFTFRLTYLGTLDEAEAVLQAVLAPLVTAEGIAMGRGNADGNGRVCLDPAVLTCTASSILDGKSEREITITQGDLAERKADAFTLELSCAGPYISVHHDQRLKKKPRGARGDDDDGVRIKPLTDPDGGPTLLPSTFMGALRARCAWVSQLEGCGEDDFDKIYDPAKSIDQLTPTERLFGVTGWRGLLRCVSVELMPGWHEEQITSVVIDRFTGGALDGALYSTSCFVGARYKVGLQLEERMSLTLDSEIKLLKFLIENLEENGLMLGHGVNAGYGWFDIGKKGAGLTDDEQ